jgi:hypothetical protein
MDNTIQQKLMLIYNTLNVIEVKGINNLANLANSINLLKEVIETQSKNTRIILRGCCNGLCYTSI